MLRRAVYLELSSYLDSRLAERTSVHMLDDIYGMGVLIQGDSGTRKRETALGTCGVTNFVADDRVDIYEMMTLGEESLRIYDHLPLSM